MPVSPGSRALKTFRGEYDFAVDGGAIGTIPLRGDSGALPVGSLILGGVLEILTAFTTGSAATAALTAEAANDIQTATVVSGAPYSTTGQKSITPAFTGATSIKATVDRSPSIVIATGTITAGKLRLTLFYV